MKFWPKPAFSAIASRHEEQFLADGPRLQGLLDGVLDFQREIEGPLQLRVQAAKYEHPGHIGNVPASDEGIIHQDRLVFPDQFRRTPRGARRRTARGR